MRLEVYAASRSLQLARRIYLAQGPNVGGPEVHFWRNNG